MQQKEPVVVEEGRSQSLVGKDGVGAGAAGSGHA